MLLSEEHRIKACSSRSLFRQIDSYCYCAKNLSNSVNYMIRQIFRIHTKLKEGKVPEEWEAELMEQVNCGIRDYNEGRAKDRTLRHIDETNGFVADAYFLSWYLKKTAEYKAMPYATKSCVCKRRVVFCGTSVPSRISGSLKGTGMACDHQPELPDR